MSNEYQGFANYPTWTVALWLSNDEASYWDAREIVETQGEQGPDGLRRLVDEMREQREPDQAHMLADILGWALEQVDWREVAEQFRE